MPDPLEPHQQYRLRERAAMYRELDKDFREWASGYGVLSHDDLTQVRVYEMVDALLQRRMVDSRTNAYRLLRATDRLTSAAMWLVVHMTYARRVYTDGRELNTDDFKTEPEGHTGGALNMVAAYVGYLTINALSGKTRSWLMGQGHCVAAIDAVNLVADNMSPEQNKRYSYSDVGLTKFVRDFYSCEIGADGRPASPLGSHVNAHTAGGLIEGGYLGFAELLYVHMPLPGEQLVAFLSDGAFEEQRGSDWIPRWWRAKDTGLVAPIMIANGRRIDQRSTMAQIGGVEWFRKHLMLNGFDPIDLDGRDPAAFAWAIFEIEERLAACAHAETDGRGSYPVPLHYGIAETVKGFGFPGAGTNRAHNLPLDGNPSTEDDARRAFNQGASKLWVSLDELNKSVLLINNHTVSSRPQERDHPIAVRTRREANLPEPPWKDVTNGGSYSPMVGMDEYFSNLIRKNPHLRPRVGNPDEMRSNRMNETLDLLKHRVTAPEQGLAEAIDGCVITALNEEAVVCAALGNKGGINLVVSYEAFAVKMLGALRQDLIFTRNLIEAGREPYWLSLPVLATSHAWENGKNELSHQDPTLCEALMCEMSDLSRVVFPPDCNSAIACLQEAYRTHGQIWTMVIPKRKVPLHLSQKQAVELLRFGAVQLVGTEGDDNQLQLVAIGAYQLGEVLKASSRLVQRGMPHAVIYLLEPGRFRSPRDSIEAAHQTSREIARRLFPQSTQSRVFVSHTRPECLSGIVRSLDTGWNTTRFLGFLNRGGTLDVNGMLFVNSCT